MSFNNELSIYIPRVFANWRDSEKMSKVFEDLNIGQVRRIDFVDKETPDGNKYSQAFIHFHVWYDNGHTRNLQARIEDPNDTAKIVYDDPWYWMLFKNSNPLSETELRLHERMAEMEKTHAKAQSDNEYWMRTMLNQLNNQNENIGHMWNHCVSQGLQTPKKSNNDYDYMNEEEDQQVLDDVDNCIEDALRSRREFEVAMDNINSNVRTSPIEISDSGSDCSLIDNPQVIDMCNSDWSSDRSSSIASMCEPFPPLAPKKKSKTRTRAYSEGSWCENN